MAVSFLFAIAFDPPDPSRFTSVTYGMQGAYALYSLVLLAFVWRRPIPAGLPIATHVADIVAFSILQYLTLGPSSPFFVYFVFALFCGAVRWGWRGTLGTAPFVLVAFVAMGAAMSRTFGAGGYEMNRFVIRMAQLTMVAGLLVYLGLHEAKLREEMQRLARWPATTATDTTAVVAELLRHAASIVGAPGAVLVWEPADEPWVYVEAWSADGPTLTRHAPTEFEPLVADGYAAFVSADTSMVHPALRARLPGGGLASAAFDTERVSGRAFFTGLREVTADVVPLVEIVVRELGASIGEALAATQLQQLAIREERIRVARDLHDGVLQAMTGIRFELQAIAHEEAIGAGDRDRLLALERALATEQRELRLFIEDLKPLSQPARPGGTLAPRLEELRQRLADEWKLPIALRLGRFDRPLPPGLEGAVPLMVHEAVVNALKHAGPSKVTIDIGVSGSSLAIAVSDDGRGFAFRGRYDHEALDRHNIGPVSLRERVAALGGRLAIESGPTGSRIDVELPIPEQESAWRSA